MSLSKLRAALYRLARIAGDVQAVKSGKVEKRVERRIAGKFTARILGKLFR